MRNPFLLAATLVLASAGGSFAQPLPPGPNGGPYWVGAEYLLWFTDQPRPEPLVTSGPPSSQGILGRPGTDIVFGDSKGNHQAYSGAKLSAGAWLTGMVALEGNVFFLNNHNTVFEAGSDAAGSPVLARPVINVLTGQESIHFVSLPGAFAGDVVADLSTRMWGSEGNLIYNPFHSVGNYPEWIFGFRYLELNEHLNIADTTTILPGGVSNFNGFPVFAPNRINTIDHFGTRNQFYGGQIGLRSRYDFRFPAFIEMTAKVALGNTHQVLDILGFTTLLPPAGPSNTTNGGLLALGSNIGRHERDSFTVVPEVNIRATVWVNEWLNLWVAYNVIYWSDVARPGDQLDRNINVRLDPRSSLFGQPLGGPNVPGVIFRERDMWIHGLNFGLAFLF